MLFPWNVFITCRSYLSSRLQGSQYADNFSNFFSIGFMISNFVVLFYIQFMPSAQGGGVRQLLRRIMISFFINACVFVVCLTLASVSTGKDFAYAFFYINIVLVITCGTSTAFLQNAVFGLVSSVFPGVYMQAVMSGQGLAACLVALSQMINSLLDSGENAVMYFSFALFVIGVCVASGALLPNLHSFKEYSKLHSASSSVSKDAEIASKNDQEEEALFDPDLEETFDLDRTTSVTSSQKLWFVMSKIKLSAAAVFITFFVTLSLFPSVLNLMRSSYGGSSEAETRWREELFLPLAFLSFAVSDWIGKSMPGVKLFVDFGALKSPVVILVCSVLRVAFIPLFLVCNVVIMDPVTMDPLPRVFLNTLITNDYFVLIIVFVFGLTNGYLSSLAMMHAPNLIKENGSSYEQLGILTKDNEAELKQLAGTAMVFCLTFGLTVGSFFSFALRSALCGFCDPFVN